MFNSLINSPKQSPRYLRALHACVVAGFVFIGPCAASPWPEADAIPHIDAKARENFLAYRHAGKHKAFAIAPGGAWAWRSDAVSEQEAEQLALDTCRNNTAQKCVLYALNERIVFDAKRWPKLWGPYVTTQYALEAVTGAGLGQRFYDLAYKTPGGKQSALSRLRGKVVFVHFWGSWCPPCMREFPSLKQLQNQLQEQLPGDVAMVLLQVREPYKQSRQWAAENDFDGLPLFDSGATGGDHTSLLVSDGSAIEDRHIARVFPSSYVLDRNGIVVFSHFGPVENWLDYIPFIGDVVQRSPQPGDTAGSAQQGVTPPP